MKTTEEIYNEMAAEFAAKTGAAISASGDLAVRLWAVAAELNSLYVQSDWVERQCFPQTADGLRLDRHGEMRGITRRAAANSVGTLRFSADKAGTTDSPIPRGTVCMTAGLVRFETTAPAVLAAGATQVDVPARAIEAGTAGNAAAATILTMSVPPMGVARCTNPNPFGGGLDEEGDEELRGRILETYQRLPNGANAAFYYTGAMSFTGVAACTVVPRARGVGTVDVVVSSPAGLPDSNLLAELAAYFSARREIAVDVAVKAPTTSSIIVTVAVKPKSGYTYAAVSAKVDSVLRGYFDGRLLGKSILRAKLGELIFAIEGVENYALTAPSGDVAVGAAVLPRLTTLTITEMT
ncbi:MAG: baseplate J/gp47 family protein [Oscillospiraceae bacterium]